MSINKIEHFWQKNHFGENYFTYPNLYSTMVKIFSTGSRFVEIGSWKGRSAAFMAVEINNSGKIIQFDCVDTWLGSSTEKQHCEDADVKNGTLFDAFIANIDPIKHLVNPVVADSVSAAKLYQDKSVDFVFIDGDHRYEMVVRDIEAWFPKLKIGGIIAGHDYAWCTDVRRAVHDYFGQGVSKYEDQYGEGYESFDDAWGEGCWVVDLKKVQYASTRS